MPRCRLPHVLLAVAALAASGLSARAEDTPVVKSLKDLTSAPARVVWMQGQQRGGTHDPVYTLVGYDTEDGKGERTILGKVGSYFKPLLTPDGKRVVFTDGTTWTVYSVNFDGTDLKEVGKGQCLQLWRDPATGKAYAFIQRGKYEGETFRNNPMYKVSLDDPAKAELAWDKTPVTYDNFQVSRDGTRATMEGPWPRCVVATLPNGEWGVFGRGCYTQTAPDDSYVTAHLDGMHRNFLIFKPDGSLHARVTVNAIEGFKNRKIHQPRWSNHPLFFTMGGPQPEGGAGSYKDVEMWVGKYAKDLTKVEAYVKVSDNDKAELYPDLWVSGGETATLDPALFPQKPKVEPLAAGEAKAKWPGPTGTDAGLVFLWDNAGAKNAWADAGGPRSAMLEAKGSAIFGPRREMLLAGGRFVQKPETDNAALVDAVKKAGAFTLEAVITPDAPRGRRWQTVLTLAPPAPTERAAPDLLLTVGRGGVGLLVADRLWPETKGRAGEFETVGPVEAGKPAHVLIAASGREVRGYVNGEKVYHTFDGVGDYSVWQKGPLVFGAADPSEPSLKGGVEMVALFARAMPEREARDRWAMARERLKDRKPVDRLVVEATLETVTNTPAVESLAPYTRALVEYQWKVEKVVSGKDPGKEIVVRHWAVLDNTVQKALAARKAGERATLTLEPYAYGKAHAELDGERTATDLPSATARTLPVYYDATRDGVTPAGALSEAELFRETLLDGEPEELAALLEKNPDLATRTLPAFDDKTPVTPVELSADNTNAWKRTAVANTRVLLRHGATIDFPTACRAGLLDVVRKMLEKDPSLLTRKDAKGYTPLQRCTIYDGFSRDAEAVADYLVSKGAEVDIFIAATQGNVAKVKELLSADKALAKAVDPAGETALMWAVRPKRDDKQGLEVAKLLLAAGANPNATARPEKATVLMMASEWGEKVDFGAALVAGGADVNAADARGWTALDYAEDNRERKMAEFIRSKGGKPGKRGK